MDMPPMEVYLRDFGDTDDTRRMYWCTYLLHTDYVAAKIAEAAYLGTEVEEKYRAVLEKREEARQQLNELEKTKEE